MQRDQNSSSYLLYQCKLFLNNSELKEAFLEKLKIMLKALLDKEDNDLFKFKNNLLEFVYMYPNKSFRVIADILKDYDKVIQRGYFIEVFSKHNEFVFICLYKKKDLIKEIKSKIREWE